MTAKKQQTPRVAKTCAKLIPPTYIPNMNILSFKAAANIAKFSLTARLTSFPSDEELKGMTDADCISEAIIEFLRSITQSHKQTWQKMLSHAYPELADNTLERLLVKLVVRCWKLRANMNLFNMHDFIEFCAGQGNLTAECLKALLHGAALDIQYRPDHNMLTRAGLRVWIDCISEAKPGALVWHATRCSSFVNMSRRHHMRSAENGFWGNCQYAFVRDGNTMQVNGSVTCRKTIKNRYLYNTCTTKLIYQVVKLQLNSVIFFLKA